MTKSYSQIGVRAFYRIVNECYHGEVMNRRNTDSYDTEKGATLDLFRDPVVQSSVDEWVGFRTIPKVAVERQPSVGVPALYRINPSHGADLIVDDTGLLQVCDSLLQVTCAHTGRQSDSPEVHNFGKVGLMYFCGCRSCLSEVL
jgi:hypothetical protein